MVQSAKHGTLDLGSDQDVTVCDSACLGLFSLSLMSVHVLSRNKYINIKKQDKSLLSKSSLPASKTDMKSVSRESKVGETGIMEGSGLDLLQPGRASLPLDARPPVRSRGSEHGPGAPTRYSNPVPPAASCLALGRSLNT